MRQAVGGRSREKPSLRRRALLGAAGLAGAAVLTRLARGGELSPPAGPIMPTGVSLSAVSGKIDAEVATLNGKIDKLDGKVAFSPTGIAEPRTPIVSLPSSPDAQFVITEPGAYYLSSNLTQEPGKVCIDIQADHVDIDGQGFVFGGGGGGGGGFSSCIRASSRQAIELYDCAFRGWQGVSCDFTDCDDVYLSDVLFHSCVSPSDPGTGGPGAVVRCRDRCGIEDVAVSSCTGGMVEMRHSSYCFELTVTDSIGLAVRCGDGCCIEASHFIRVEGDVILTGGRSCVSECDIRQSNGVAVSTGSACVVECCECVGGTGGGIRCADGCCVEDCTVINKDAVAIECGSRSSVTENRVVLCWGISCGSESSCCDNELSSCSGGPDSPEGLGGAITLRGSQCTCEDNWISSSRVGISVHATGSSCLVSNNFVTGAGAGGNPATGPSAGIVVHDAAGAVLCTCNHVQAFQGTAPYVLGTAAHGPIVVVSSGDISLSTSSSHPLANTAI
jgi:hypothetical protein